MDDYVLHGVIDAMAAVKACTGAARIHTLGYCLGGTFLAIAAALHGKSRRMRRGADAPAAILSAELPELASVVLLAAETDFSEPGDLGVFIDEDQVKTLREAMARTGYLSGRQMAASFQFLNARDLVWSRNARRYWIGAQEVQNDLMSWNSDVTRLPQRMHSEYLGSLFLHNALAEGHYQVDGTAVALIDIAAPMLVVGTTRDHVCPWRSVYKIHLSTDVETTFVLAAGGHNAGIVSEPGHPGRSYQMATSPKGHGWVDPDAWLRSAPLHSGSWWESMAGWLGARSGAPVPARSIPLNRALGDAPGEYVLVRYAD
jgi:polyhydroxyalkanoate synthase